MSLPDYQPLTSLFAQRIDPAECHGLLCGMLCANPTLTTESWLAVTHHEIPQNQATLDELRLLFNVTLQQLDSDDFELNLLLPDDDQALYERTEALGLWCQGFLAGLGLAGFDSMDELTGETREFLDDVSQIARIGFDTRDGDESDEQAYAEIVEYLRIGVLLFHQTRRPHPVNNSHRLH